MQLEEGISLIRHDINQEKPQKWLDLGCGKGFFTLALAALLPHESEITAIDKSASGLRQIPASAEDVKINPLHADFTKDNLPTAVDGILMANALHYVKRSEDFLARLYALLVIGGEMLVVEYDTERANPWVPYPLPEEKLRKTLLFTGFGNIEKLGSRQGNFGKAMYALKANKS